MPPVTFAVPSRIVETLGAGAHTLGAMCNIPGRSRTALVVIDVQVGVVADTYRRDAVVANIARLVQDARRHRIPVIWVQHSDEELVHGSADWAIVPELIPLAEEPLVHKHFRSSFEGTNFEEQLAAHDVAHVVVCGAQTEFCVRNTVHAAYERGYDVTLVEDAHTTADAMWDGEELPAREVIAAQNRVCSRYELPGRTCDVVSTADAFAALSL